jgi:hypothetical protein
LTKKKGEKKRERERERRVGTRYLVLESKTNTLIKEE